MMYLLAARHRRLPIWLLFPALLTALVAGCHRGEDSASAARENSTVAEATSPAVAGAPGAGAPRAGGLVEAPTTLLPEPLPTPPKYVKGIYISGWIAGGTKRWSELLDLVDKSEINSVVIDVRDDGAVSYKADVPLVAEMNASPPMVQDMKAKLDELKKRKIFPIARITCFRDEIAPKKRPDLAIQKPDGTPWRDRAGHYWLDPYNQKNWDYAADLAIDALKQGFGEIQWDYVRFPSEGDLKTMRFPAKPKDDPRSRARVIADFLKHTHDRLKPYGAPIAADIFGLTVSARPDDDMGIGQKIDLILPQVDTICPMMYPSHYNKGEYGIPNPNAAPYRTVHKALDYAVARVKGSDTKIRPWLQDFSLGYRYGKAEVLAQIKAAREHDIHEYLIWNAGNRYTSAAYIPPKPQPAKTNKSPAKTAGADTKSGEKSAPAINSTKPTDATRSAAPDSIKSAAPAARN